MDTPRTGSVHERIHDDVQAHAHATPHAAPTGFIRKYIFSLDHKVIGIQYFFLALTAVFVGMFLSLLMRIHLIWPDAHPFGIRTQAEIEQERYALKAMRGDFGDLGDLDGQRSSRTAALALKAVER